MATKPIVVDRPEPGIWKLRLVSGGWHEVPCRIILQDGLWSAEVDGEPAGLPNADPVHADGVLSIWHTRKTPITEAEYAFLAGRLKAWAREFYPDHPLLNPRQKMRTTALRPIPQFSPPPAPAPLDPEDETGENRPAAPTPLTAAQVKEWLDFDNETLAKQIERDVAVLAKDREVVINTDAELARVSANVAIGTGRLRQAEKNRTVQKAPFRQGGEAVDAWYKRWTEPLRLAIEPVQKAMDAYGTKVEAARRAEAERKAEEARLEADRLAARAQSEMRRNPVSVAATVLLDEAATAAKQADAAGALASGRSADLTRTTGSYGGTVSGQEVWGFEVEDISKVPLEYLQINETLALAAMKAYARTNPEQARAGTSPIAGLRITRRLAMRNR